MQGYRTYVFTTSGTPASHTCATLLLSKGVHPKIVHEMLGHSTISFTLDTYERMLPNMQKEAVKAMEDTLDCS